MLAKALRMVSGKINILTYDSSPALHTRHGAHIDISWADISRSSLYYLPYTQAIGGEWEYKLTNNRILVYYLTLTTRETRRYAHTNLRNG